ncbi:uncharacterized protein N7515_001148 [Penicillium bovifimosum]|uniref:Uncharacterized protein n=1 Tax=Penicillium bovifimosum TaxID=126998 RepID=A0A9W9HHF5_9EURO|nr:uncharacterized protein N7515_001148 [Penicillium bovifimosum]KAJ5146584.1 hypothetical protein N7515_001148 [Penicillium bovifimosum]
MEQPSDRPKPKRRRPPKYTTVEERKAAQSAREREKRQAARAAQPLKFVHYHSPSVPRSTGINESPLSYFPPGELSITTEVERQAPSLSPGLASWEPSTLEFLPVDDELSLKSMPDVSNEPATHTTPETAPSEINPAGPIPETAESLIQEPATHTPPETTPSEISPAGPIPETAESPFKRPKQA